MSSPKNVFYTTHLKTNIFGCRIVKPEEHDVNNLKKRNKIKNPQTKPSEGHELLQTWIFTRQEEQSSSWDSNKPDTFFFHSIYKMTPVGNQAVYLEKER